MPELRPAEHADIPRLHSLIALSGRVLSADYYSPPQAEAITRYVFGVDTQLIDDRTYFVIEHDKDIVACGGWSKRRTLFGGDQTKSGPDPLLDSSRESARIRAFFVTPSMARRGLGRQLMGECIAASKQEGFNSLELVATSPGEPLYLAAGFSVLERFNLNLPGNIEVPVCRMRMAI